MTFGERLKQLRVANNFNQEELSEQINKFFHTKISKFTISRLENDVQKPTVELLEIFAQYFDTSLDFLCGGGKFGIDSEYDKIMEIRQGIRENSDMKILFSLTKEAPKADVQEAIRMLLLLKKARGGGDV